MTAYVTAASGNWSLNTNWTPNGVPGNGDNITAINHAMTVDTNTIIGVSPATAGTAAIIMNANVAVTIAAGVTLTCRGDFTGKMTGSTVIDQLILGAGSVFEFDTSQAASPTSQMYAFRQTGNNQWWRIVCTGTGPAAGQYAEIRSNASGGVGFFDNSFVGGPYFHCVYTRFLRMGSSAKTFMEIYVNGGSLPEMYFQQCIFDATGRIFQRSSSTAGVVVTYDRCVWINSANADDNVRPGELSGAGSLGTITDCYMDCGFSPFTGMQNWTLTNNAFARGYAQLSFATKATLSQNNLYCFISNNAGAAIADFTNDYWLNESTSDNNPHGFSTNPNFSITLTGLVFECSYTGAGQTEADLIIVNGTAPGSTTTVTVKNNLVLPQPDLTRASGVLVSMFASVSANWKFVIEHNTVWDVRNTGGGNYGLFNVGESGGGVAGACTSMKSNLTYSTTATSNAYVARLAASTLQDAVSAANVTNNANINAYTGSGGFAGFDDGTGGGSMFSTGTPNASGVTLSGNPFVDTGRRAAAWAGQMGGTATNAGVRTLMRIRVDWSDVNYAPNNGATPAVLTAWVKAGWHVTGTQGALLASAGHDGVTIGALPFDSTVTLMGQSCL